MKHIRAVSVKVCRPLVSAIFLGLVTWAQADRVNIPHLQGLLPKAEDSLQAHAHDFLGDTVSLFNGSLEFVHTDANIPGNSALPVHIVRKHVAGRTTWIRGVFGDWDMEIPRVSGVFASSTGWVNSSGGTARCSGFSAPPTQYRTGGGGGGPARAELTGDGAENQAAQSPTAARPTQVAPLAVASVTFQAEDYWQGTSMQMPGAGSQELLRRNSGDTWQPTDGHNYPLVTKGGWQIRCLSAVQNAAGEGFLALAPDGTRYQFDWMAKRFQPAAQREGARLARDEYMLMATVVTDRFGGEVRYTYDAANPTRLISVVSSDNRQIQIAYDGSGRVDSITAGSRLWLYRYSSGGDLETVTLPDQSQWRFNLRPLVHYNVFELAEHANCESSGFYPSGNYTGTVKHPSGATGTFTMRYVQHPRANVTRWCTFVGTKAVSAVWPRSTVSLSLVSKNISGPGLPPSGWQWGYAYTAGAGTWGTAATPCQSSKTTVVNNPPSEALPAGSQTHLTFGICFQSNEGQLLARQDGVVSGQPLRSTVYGYRQPQGMPFSDTAGVSIWRDSDFLSTRNRPEALREVTQQSTTFTWQADGGAEAFDARARVIKSRMASSLGYSKSASTTYEDRTSNWVLGLPKQVVDQWGRVLFRHEFNAQTALIEKRWEYELFKGSFQYHPTGMLHRHLDPLGRATEFTDYYRGVPRHVLHRDGFTERATVNDYGRILEHTNEAGISTYFEYDPMGRLSQIRYPSEADGLVYHSTNIAYDQTTTAEHGLGAGHWRQRVTTGSSTHYRWYDALWRVRLDQKWDDRDTANTSSMTEYRWDHDGRKIFEAQPQRSITPVDMPIYQGANTTPAGNVHGTQWRYDALGRVIEQAQASEVGLLRTVTEYLGDFRKRITNPRGYESTYNFMAFDIPSEEHIAGIVHPEGIWTTIYRDTDGQPTEISRGGVHNGEPVRLSRRYLYDSHRRLCTTVDPETNATVQAFDSAGNLEWRASGQAVPSNGLCNPSSVPTAARASFTYDARNRLRTTSYGDGSAGITRDYTADGLLSSIVSGGSQWYYWYNNRRVLRHERIVFDGQSHDFVRTYESHGHIASQSYPTGLRVDYHPDAFGRPTAVSGFASAVRYWPNGSLQGYVLQNGRSHSTSINKRGLVEDWIYSGLMHDFYRYDSNANVSGIEDRFSHPSPAIERNETVYMTYDGLDRLRSVNGRTGGTYSYDPLDNLISSTVQLEGGGSRASVARIDGVTNLLRQLIVNGQELSIQYDPNGNLRERGGQGYRFDLANRNMAVLGRAEYAYDGHGRRYRASLSDGTERRYAHAQDGQLLSAWDSSYGISSYIYIGGQLIAEAREGGVSFHHPDALGSPVVTTDAAGAEIRRRTYEAYGAIASGSVTSGIGYTGHVNDSDTGLVQMQQRYYDPVAGRFLSVDPVTTSSQDAAMFNRYSYADNSPYVFYDPDGRCTGSHIKNKDETCLGGGNSIGTKGMLESMRDEGLRAFGRASAVSFVPPNVTVSLGVTGHVPLVGGASFALGVSHNNGKWDAGIVINGDQLGFSFGRMLAKAAVEFSVQSGDLRSNNGQLTQSVNFGYAKLGGSFHKDSMGKVTGASVTFGPQYGIQVAGQKTTTVSLRHDMVPAIRAWKEKVRMLLSAQPQP